MLLLLVGLGFVAVRSARSANGAAAGIAVSFGLDHAKAQVDNDLLRIKSDDLDEQIAAGEHKKVDRKPGLQDRKQLLLDQAELLRLKGAASN